MMVFKVVGTQIEPMPPGTPADGLLLLVLEDAARRTGKTPKDLRALWADKWGKVIPEEKVTGEPLSIPAEESPEVAHASMLLTDEDRDALIHEMLYPQLPAEAWIAFKVICGQRGLSIYCRHLHPEYRYDGAADQMKLVIITTIEAVRLLARRTKKCLGRTDIEWAGSDGKWVKQWDSSQGPPTWARCGVRRKGDAEPTYMVVEWSSYAPWVQTHAGSVIDPYWMQWSAMQLGKCAEVATYRAAFPEELDGIYTRDEMAQANNFGPPKPPAAPPKPDEDSQQPHDDIDEQEFYDLFEQAFPDEGQRAVALASFKVKYSKLWRMQSPQFARSVMRDLREMLEQRRQTG